jgi:hypothetical protein
MKFSLSSEYASSQVQFKLWVHQNFCVLGERDKGILELDSSQYLDEVTVCPAARGED